MNDDVANLSDQSTVYGARLCNAVKLQRCLYDPQSNGYRVKATITKAWKVVASECKDTAANCRFRWKTIRNSFARSYKKHGDKSDYYLYPFLLFLTPFLEANAEKNDESLLLNDEANKTLEEEERLESDSDTTKSAEESRKTTPRESYSEDKEFKNPNDISQMNPKVSNRQSVIILDSDDKSDDNQKEKQNDHQGNLSAMETDHNDSADETMVRRLRDRKMPQRFIEMDFSQDNSPEKRARRVAQRRKSVGGLVLKEFVRNNSFLNQEPSKKPNFVPDIPSFCDTTVDDRNLHKINGHVNFKVYSHDASALAKPTMCDNFTMTESGGNSESNKERPRRPDDDFLESLRPQMESMNLRQKVNFKRRVYESLMDVLDDATNFPNDNEIVEAASKVAKDFQTTTSSELKLMRELVAIVQAAKMTPELLESNRSIDLLEPAGSPSISTSPQKGISTPSVLPSPSGSIQLTPSSASSTLSPFRNVPTATSAASPQPSVTTVNNPLGIPRHVIQKAVKVAGPNGSTITTHDGDKRRVYRIYPKNSPPFTAQVQNNTPSKSGTLFVTPSNPTTNKSAAATTPTNQSQSSSSSSSSLIKRTSFSLQNSNPKTGNSVTLPKPMLPPSLNKTPVTANKVIPVSPASIITNGLSSQGRASIIQRRYSICGAAPTRNQTARINPKPYARPPNLSPAQLPPLQRIQNFPHQEEFQQHIISRQVSRPANTTPNSPGSFSKIQLSKPVSLNSGGGGGVGVGVTNNMNAPTKQAKLIPAINENCRPRLPDPIATNDSEKDTTPVGRMAEEFISASEASVLEMAGTIAADNFVNVLNKPIKDEPEF